MPEWSPAKGGSASGGKEVVCYISLQIDVILMACVYIIQSRSNGKLYTGSSREDDPDRRLKAHNLGKTRSTKSVRPWKLIYKEGFETFTQARKRENFLKTGVGRKCIKENVL